MRNFILYLVFISSFLTFTACKDDDPVGPSNDFGPALENIANDVILETYQQLDQQAEGLVQALIYFQNNQHNAALNGAREDWRLARVPWERSEGFLFGPVDQQGIDPAIDSWPVNETDLDAVLGSGQALTKSYIDGLDGTLKGFHTIEYLLWGTDGQKVAADFTARELEYLVACGESLKGSTHQLYNSWSATGENYVANILQAGEAGSIYPSQKAALEEIVTGMIVIADEVGNGKINDPFSQQDLTLEESRFSANSKADFTDNMRSIYLAYKGKYPNSDDQGVSSIVAAHDAALDATITSRIEEAILAIMAIEGTFTTAIFNAPQSVQNAQTKVRDLQQTLESQLLPLINSL